MFEEFAFGNSIKKEKESVASNQEQELGLIERSLAHFRAQATDKNDKSKHIRTHFISELEKAKNKLLEKIKGQK